MKIPGIKLDKKKFARIMIIVLDVLAGFLFLYLVILPFYPLLVYKNEPVQIKEKAQDIEAVAKQVQEFKNRLPSGDYAVSANRLIINKIGVNAPIVEDNNSDRGLNRGAWHMPDSSTPDKGGNTVITGHRFKYLPPSNLTFYLLDKLEKGDIISVLWEEKEYYYKVMEYKIVSPDNGTILKQTDNAILTLYTCDPIYSQKNRLVVTAELINLK